MVYFIILHIYLDPLKYGLLSLPLDHRYILQDKKKDENALQKICRDTSKMATEQIKGLSSQVIKDLLFNRALSQGPQQQAGGVTQAAPMSMES